MVNIKKIEYNVLLGIRALMLKFEILTCVKLLVI